MKNQEFLKKLNNCLKFHGISDYSKGYTIVFESILGRVFRSEKRDFNDNLLAELILHLGLK